MDTEKLAGRLGRLHTALLCDVMDGLGFRDSALGVDIRPMAPGQRLAGPAFTMRCEPMERPAADPYSHLLAAFRDITPGSVVVMRCGDRISAMWGELLSAAARVRGATGAVMDGAVRDVEQILEMGFPVFSRGFSPLDSSGRQEVVEHGRPVRCGAALVNPGDWIVGDVMGAVVIPRDLAERTAEAAEAKDAGESRVREEILRGDDIGEVFSRHGIL